MTVSVIVGLPGDLTNICCNICLDLLGASGRSAFLVDVDASSASSQSELGSLGSLADHLIKADFDVALAISRRADKAFSDSLLRSARPFLLVLEDPRRAFLAMYGCGAQADFQNAIRSAALSSACMVDLVPAPHAVKASHATLLSDPTSFARLCLAFLGIEAGRLPVADAAAIVRNHLQAGSLSERSEDVQTELSRQLDEESSLAVQGALSEYWSAFQGAPLGTVVATRVLFYSSETSAPLKTPVIDASGRARCLAFGPYLNLPAGSWTLRLVLAFSSELAGKAFTLDVTRAGAAATEELGRISFQAVVGRYVAQVTFEHVEPTKALEFRLFIDNAAFDGQVSVGYAELGRLRDQTGEKLGADLDWRGLPS